MNSAPRQRRREAVKRRPRAPTWRAAAARAPAVAAKKRVDRQRQRVLELGGDSQARARHDRRDRRAVEALEVADLGGVLALAGPPRREVGLERHLDDAPPAGARDLGEQRAAGRARARARARGCPARYAPSAAGRCSAVVERDRVDLRALARDRDGRLGDLDARRAARRSRAGAARTAARRRRSRPRACSPGRRPARAHSAITWSALPTAPSARQRAYTAASAGLLRVGVVVEADELRGVLHADDYCGRDDAMSSRRRCARPPRRCRRSRRSRCSSCGRPPGRLPGHPLGARRPDRARAARHRARRRRLRAGARCRAPVRVALGCLARTRRSATCRSCGPPCPGMRGKAPTGRCSTCSCSRCSPAGASAAQRRAAARRLDARDDRAGGVRRAARRRGRRRAASQTLLPGGRLAYPSGYPNANAAAVADGVLARAAARAQRAAALGAARRCSPAARCCWRRWRCSARAAARCTRRR